MILYVRIRPATGTCEAGRRHYQWQRAADLEGISQGMDTTVNVTARLSCCSSSIVISIAGRSAAGPGVDDRLHALLLRHGEWCRSLA
jgi:hypothetical protein